MRRLSLLLTFLALPAFADEKAKPNTLTPKEIADGWILLFDGETTFGWKVEGEAKVKEGALVLGGGEASNLEAPSFGQFRCEFEYSLDGANWKSHWIGVGLEVDDSRWEQSLKGDYEIRAKVKGEPASLGFATSASNKLFLRSVKLRPFKMTPLFNAKDLTGWKEFKSTKEKKVASEFTVTKEGWLNVKNGPGDLQTEGQWADFVVQLECISNGPHLNSGLFFRAIPDQYQLGYEAQIHNGFKGDDRTKPTDWGTGAIYRRQAARKVVANDNEWFTMTVAAHGKHLATWVNGYQVTDFTDERKEDDNARNGFKKGKGALSFQGHDKTTDLSFRNIRIQSLDK
jgi:Domain of Unknown Function (DUF1080)